MTRYNQIRVAVGWDQTLSDSDNIEAFIPNIGSPRTVNLSGIPNPYIAVFPDGMPVHSEGIAIIDPNAGEQFDGWPQVRYTSLQMHVDSYKWLKDTYRGQVTANLRTDATTYAEYNCTLRFETERSERPEFLTVTWIFTIIEAL